MRFWFSIIFICLILAIVFGSIAAARSRKAIGTSVSLLLAALLPPVIGNLMIISTDSEYIAKAGYYIYFLGMDLVMYTLLRFTSDYCGIKRMRKGLNLFVRFILSIDVIQLLCNPLFGHAFDTEAIMTDGFLYYRLFPHIGQTFHRVVDYLIFFTVIIIFFIKTVRSPRIYSERYSVVLVAMIASGIWQSYYIFSRTPIDRSMIGFALFGLTVFYLSIYYRPMRLLDRMLACIASEMPEALFFYDLSGRCILANKPGI